MSNSPDFVVHAVELLSSLERVEARAMFGGHGVYARGVMFGLLDDDELFLKTDEVSRPRFVEAGCRRWVYVGPTMKMENTSYFRPPDGAHEDAEAMLPWVRLRVVDFLQYGCSAVCVIGSQIWPNRCADRGWLPFGRKLVAMVQRGSNPGHRAKDGVAKERDHRSTGPLRAMDCGFSQDPQFLAVGFAHSASHGTGGSDPYNLRVKVSPAASRVF